MLASISDLKPGDIVRNLGSSSKYVVAACYGNRATAVRTVDITHPKEWLLIVEDSDEDPCAREPGVLPPPGWESLILIHSETGATYPLKVPRGKYRIEVNGKPALAGIEGGLLVVIP